MAIMMTINRHKTVRNIALTNDRNQSSTPPFNTENNEDKFKYNGCFHDLFLITYSVRVFLAKL